MLKHLKTKIPTRHTAPARTVLGRWFFHGGRIGEEFETHKTHSWYLVLWLTGVDYFSTLGYQPGIALLAAGALSPLATAVLVAVTLLGAFPIYAQVAKRSYVGQGSIAMLENLLPAWSGKILVLVLLGFAATDFVITMTLSAADAAQHVMENPVLLPHLGEVRIILTIGMLALLAVVFLKGFTEAIGLATVVVIPYLFLNVIVLIRCVLEILRHPGLMIGWRSSLGAHGDWTMLLVASALIFPRLALGMSGFETGVSVMPLIANGHERDPRKVPTPRVRATRKLLFSAAMIMGVMLLLSSFVTTMMIPENAYKIGGSASGRAISYLAHGLLGHVFGTVYDISTIAILWFAGASAMAGLLNLIPRYLPRYGMAPRWVAYRRPLVLTLFTVSVIITMIFKASVEAQAGAYATGVLALILSAGIAVALALWRDCRERTNGRKTSMGLSLYFWMVSAVFMYTLIDNIYQRPDGVIIAGVFITVIVLVSALSRYRRAKELRVSDITFMDGASAALWNSLINKKVNLVPIRTCTPEFWTHKAGELQNLYRIRHPLAFINVNLLDNRSEFMSPLRVQVRQDGESFIIQVWGAVAIANTIAYVSELIHPVNIFLGLTRGNLITQALRYLLWGEGEIGLMVYAILIRYWEWTPEEVVRTNIILASE